MNVKKVLLVLGVVSALCLPCIGHAGTAYLPSYYVNGLNSNLEYCWTTISLTNISGSQTDNVTIQLYDGVTTSTSHQSITYYVMGPNSTMLATGSVQSNASFAFDLAPQTNVTVVLEKANNSGPPTSGYAKISYSSADKNIIAHGAFAGKQIGLDGKIIEFARTLTINGSNEF
jgi:hypothetical protein